MHCQPGYIASCDIFINSMVSWQEYHSGIEHKTPETETQLIFLLHGYVCGFNEL